MRIVLTAMAIVCAASLLGAVHVRQPADQSNVMGGQAGGMNAVSEGYVKLVLAMGAHDPDYVETGARGDRYPGGGAPGGTPDSAIRQR